MSLRLSIPLCLALAAIGCTGQAPQQQSQVAWRPFELGSHHRAVSTESEAAQLAFDQGLVWMFGFNHGEAIRAFEEAERQDPQLAMAAWGIALANGPHINNPALDAAHAEAAWEALQRARSLAQHASPVEQALIEALGARYAWPAPEDRSSLDADYANAMAGVAEAYPDDPDVAALYAEALMDTRPWAQWTHDGQPEPGTKEVLASLERALQIEPDHPLALHLTIHALEASPQPERAAEAADRLRGLVPDSSHLLHMPGHIDVRLGKWTDAAKMNEEAMRADARYRERQDEPGFYELYMAHNVHFLAYAAMMEGRRDLALQKGHETVANLTPEKVQEAPEFLDAFATTEQEVRKRFGRWEEILAEPLPPESMPVSLAYAHMVRGVALASTDRLDDAAVEQAAFLSSLDRVPDEYYWGSNDARSVLDVAVPYLEGEIAYHRGEYDASIAVLRKAVELEDALKYDEPPPWTTPVRHALGAVLLAAERPAEAETVYREDLKRYPENGWSLWGLTRSLRAQGKTAEAEAVQRRFDTVWAEADAPIESSCYCVAGKET